MCCTKASRGILLKSGLMFEIFCRGKGKKVDARLVLTIMQAGGLHIYIWVCNLKTSIVVSFFFFVVEF